MDKYIIKFPHCDQNVLHRKGKCDYCDMHPELQEERIRNKINFTGELDPNKEPCPSDIARGFKQAEKWHGNAPTKIKYDSMCIQCSGPASTNPYDPNIVHCEKCGITKAAAI